MDNETKSRLRLERLIYISEAKKLSPMALLSGYRTDGCHYGPDECFPCMRREVIRAEILRRLELVKTTED